MLYVYGGRARPRGGRAKSTHSKIDTPFAAPALGTLWLPTYRTTLQASSSLQNGGNTQDGEGEFRMQPTLGGQYHSSNRASQPSINFRGSTLKQLVATSTIQTSGWALLNQTAIDLLLSIFSYSSSIPTYRRVVVIVFSKLLLSLPNMNYRMMLPHSIS